ncbi:MAG: hypothetical protein JWO56_2509 [Acidobacteria bacterium]|nr:hypothetical protein [Acidobacteriota bacterium]
MWSGAFAPLPFHFSYRRRAPRVNLSPMYKRITPILIVNAIEPVLPLWDALGFQRGPSVPHGDRLGFQILEADGIEVMYQTVASVQDDAPRVLEGPRPLRASIYIEVADLDAIEQRLPKDVPIVVPRRTTPYGARELSVLDAAGNVIGFAQFG